MRVFAPDMPDLALPTGHRFPAVKYALLRQAVVARGIIAAERLETSPIVSLSALLRAHEPEYVRAVLTGTLSREAQKAIGLPWSSGLVRRATGTVGGTLAASRAALLDGCAGQLAGGTHHAHRGFGSGYCVFNDCAVASMALLDEGLITRVGVLDLDVHQGDGNAAMLGPNPSAFVASVHGARNFPFEKVAGDLDIALDDGADDTTYLAACSQALVAVLAFKPGLVFYIAGVDPLACDRLGRMSVSSDGLIARDRMVFMACQGAGVPVCILIGGGYGEPITATVDAYGNTFAVAQDVFG
jgi:acetoin utilization deacetylase AcuC-like enzyme